MEKSSVEFLQALIGTPSPSGYEMGIQGMIRERMTSFCETTRLDVHGNAIGVVNAKAPVRLMLSGHCDEIGFMIMHVDDKGFLYFASVGGLDPSIAVSQRVRIHARQGPVLGVIGRKPVHLMENDERGRPVRLHDLWIDIGAKDKKDALRHVEIGDYATIDAEFAPLQNDLVTGRGFDDRAGAFVVLETLRKLARRKLNVAVYGVSTVQEEIGLRGARTSCYGIDPHIGIAIDVGFATDCPGTDAKIVGECFLGRGAVISRGPNINPVLGHMLEGVAKKKRIPYQVQAEPRATGTDANAMQISRSGVATALVHIPNRYMHTSVEVISLRDLDSTSTLLAEFVVSLPGKLDLTPRSRASAAR